jgi:hypothetical protein
MAAAMTYGLLLLCGYGGNFFSNCRKIPVKTRKKYGLHFAAGYDTIFMLI